MHDGIDERDAAFAELIRNSTINSPFLAAMPISMMTAIWLKVFTVRPNSFQAFVARLAALTPAGSGPGAGEWPRRRGLWRKRLA